MNRVFGWVFGGIRNRWNAGERPPSPLQALTASGIIAYDRDVASDRLIWGPNLRQVFGLDRRHRLTSGRSFRALIAPGSGTTPDDLLQTVPADLPPGPVPYHCRYVVTVSGRSFAVDDHGLWSTGADGRPLWGRGVLRARSLATAEHTAGSASARDAARDIVAHLLFESGRDRRRVSIITLGLDMPDGGPLPAGIETATQVVAGRLGRRLRRNDHIFMLAPGRICIVLAACDLAEAQDAADRLRLAALAALRSILVTLGGQGDAATVRIGVVTASLRSADDEALIERSEEALDSARSRDIPVAVLPPRLRRRPVRQSSAAADLDLLAGLNDRRIHLLRQPLREASGAASALAMAMPALATTDGRWVTGDALRAAAFRRGLAPLLDHRQLELAVAALREEPAASLILTVSPATAADPLWRGAVAAHLGVTPTLAGRLAVALDERVLGTDDLIHSDVAGALMALRALGVGIVLAGFGTGRTTIDDLGALPVDFIAIDTALTAAAEAGTGTFVLRALAASADCLGVPALLPAGAPILPAALPADADRSPSSASA